MAALAEAQRSMMIHDGDTTRMVLLSVRNVTTGDTLDLAPWLVKIRAAYVIGMTVLGAGVCTVAGSVVTFTPTGMVNDGGFLVAVGSAS